MDNKKKIGDFFNDGIQGTSLEPNVEVWSRISETLNKKKKRRFFWFILASLAFVSLALYFTFFQILSNYQNTTITKPQVTTNKNGDASKAKPISNKNENLYPSANKQNNNTKDSIYLSETTANKNLEKNQNRNPSNKIVSKKKNTNTKKYKNTSTNYKVTRNNLTKNTKSKPSDTLISNNEVVNSTYIDTIGIIKGSTNSESIINKKSNDTISKKNKDSLKVNKKRTRRIVKNIAEEEIIKKDSSSLSKLNFTVQFSPIVSRYLTDRNFLIPETQITNKQVRLSYSYRLLLTIPIKERINFRLGIAHQEFRYNAEFIPNTTVTNNYGGIIISNIDFPLSPLNQNISNDLVSETPIEFEHKIRYLQFPFELNYKLKEKDEKIGINLISGYDFFVLQDDDVLISSVSTNDFFVGRANFLSDFSVAIHAGIGFEYLLSEKLKFQLEPTIIYQIGGYKNEVRNPNPIYFSLYTGFNLRF